MKRILSLAVALCLLAVPAAVSRAFSEESTELSIEAPAGMTAESIGGFVYFVWDDWVMTEESDEAEAGALSRIFVRNAEDEGSASCYIMFIETADRTDGLTPDTIIQGTFLGMAMAAVDDEEQSRPVGYEPLRIRGIDGYLFTINNKVLWMGAVGSAVISGGFHDPALSAAEARAMLYAILGASEPEPKPMEGGDPALLGSWGLSGILDISGEPLGESIEGLDDLIGSMVYLFSEDGTCTIRYLISDATAFDVSGTYRVSEDGALIFDWMGTTESYTYTVDGDTLRLRRNGYTQILLRQNDE